jgi:hypothetical protein
VVVVVVEQEQEPSVDDVEVAEAVHNTHIEEEHTSLQDNHISEAA